MKKIYLVQKMEREAFKKCAHNHVKVSNLDVNGQVVTLWCESKKRAIEDCRMRNQQDFIYTWFVNPIDDYRE